MRRRSAFAIGIIVGTLILSTAVPAHAAVRLRQYKGQTSQAHNISFFVARTDAGRFIKEMRFNVDLTCDDQTTQRVGVGYGLGRTRCPSPTEPSRSTISIRARPCMSPETLGGCRGRERSLGPSPPLPPTSRFSCARPAT